MVDESLEGVISIMGCLCVEIKGTSMNPLLKQGVHKVYLETPASRLKKGDVALYKRSSGEYVLHRVMKVLPDSYVFCGDNHFMLEFGITDQNVIGVMKGYYEGEKYTEVDKSLKYKLYKFFWCDGLKRRKFFNWFRNLFSKFSKKS